VKREENCGWRRNLYIICAAEMVALLGLTSSDSFLPFFIQELGVTNLEQVGIWSGLVTSSTMATLAVFSPIWGSVADRVGRKLMLERAIFGGALAIGAMVLVRNVQQLLILRILLGCLSGTMAAATALVAAIVPRDKTGYGMGLIQMALFAGMAAGPMLGGLAFDMVGYRLTFWIMGAMLLAAGLAIWMLVEERFKPPPRSTRSATKRFFKDLGLSVCSKPLLTLATIVLLTQAGAMGIRPILPLFVRSLDPMEEGTARVAGVILGTASLAGALAAVIIGRISDRLGYRKALIWCALGGALLYTPQAFVGNNAQLLVLSAGAGACLGGVMSMANAIAATIAPKGQEGLILGLIVSFTTLGGAIGPLINVFIAPVFGLRSVFLGGGAILALVGILASRLAGLRCINKRDSS